MYIGRGTINILPLRGSRNVNAFSSLNRLMHLLN